MYHFGECLIDWYDSNKRNLPWRHTQDPYKIWISEIMLQQTRVEQGLSYYLNFINRFPNIDKLATADRDEVFKMWQGLGYYNRADNMLHTAKIVSKELGGRFPADYDELLKLKGIGNYTAAAISSIAFNICKPVVDGNVFRVLSRLFAIKTPINTSLGKKEFELIASELMVNHPPGTFNQAIMEFGALFCKPKNPDCQNCILNMHCQAWKEKGVGNYPVKIANKTIRKRFFYYLLIETVINNVTFFLIKKRRDNDIWKNLYDFPLVELNSKIDPMIAFKQFPPEINLNQTNCHILHISKSYQHQLTHQQINAVFIRVSVNKIEEIEAEKSILLVDINNIINYPVSRMVERYLQDQKII